MKIASLLMIPALILSLTGGALAAGVDGSCRANGIRLHGKVKVVRHHPDLKVQIVNHHPDLKVQVVDHFPNSCGRWQMVDSFPDFTIQFVDAFPDIRIRYVGSFPGRP